MSLVSLVKRRMSRFVAISPLPQPERTIVTFTFDDCPRSAIETALPMLEAEGWSATIYVACGLCDTTNHLGLHISRQDIVDIHARGHEIGDHTFSHVNTMDVSLPNFLADIDRNQATLKELGLPPSQHFAYPFGEVRPALKRALRKRFNTLRGVVAPKDSTQDANLLNAMRIYSGPSLDAAIKQLSAQAEAPQWLHFFTHDVRENPSEYGCTPDEFQRIVDAVKQSGVAVMTVDQAYQNLQQKRHLS